MFKTLTLYGLLGLPAAAALAQGDGAPTERPAMQAREQAPADQGHERRVALRAALMAQREGPAPRGSAAGTEHQLNEKERAELRQQLRQQRRE